MPRILVADDNSNIQKMVALALKDEGIDVVAVGNGEAAMRRIPDLRPDLVLADIFMPVRNGYEVCEFVKSDSRYMNTPVVLLVGAFDPLDEQETQRVRADGVLKKPFVPPDPLINMVKALLAKSNGQKPAGMPLPAPLQPSAPVQPATPIQSGTPVQGAMPVQPATPANAAPLPPPPAAPFQLSPSSEVAAPRSEEAQQLRTKISASGPATPATFINSKASQPEPPEMEDSDGVTTAVRDPNLGDPFWATPAEPQEVEEESETKPADMIDMHSFGTDESSVEREDGPPSHFHPELLPLDAPLDNDDFAADSQAAPASQPPAREADERNNAVAQPTNVGPSSSALRETPEVFKSDPALTFPAVTQEAATEAASNKSDSSADEAPWLESALSDDAAPLAWPPVTSSTGEPVAPDKKSDAPEQIQPIELDLPSLPDHEAVITAATEAARRAFSELHTLPSSGTSFSNFGRGAGAGEQKHAPSAPPNTAPSPTPEMIEAVVSRMLERMQPEIMEMVNREVLRPAIEAMVRRELKKN